MRVYRRTGVIFFLSLVMLSSAPAMAQVGFGFGIGGWGHGNHTYWAPAFWVNVWPQYRYRVDPDPRTTTAAARQPGVLAGQVIVQPACPAAKPAVACPVPNVFPADVAVTATPYGSRQWLATRPDAQGRYHFVLAPGGYTLQVQSPSPGVRSESRNVIVQPGKTLRIDVPVTQAVQ